MLGTQASLRSNPRHGPTHPATSEPYRRLRDHVTVFDVARSIVRPRVRRRLLANGVPGIARITSSRDTGWRILGRPLITYGLQVTVDGVTTYPTMTREAVSLTSLAQAAPGASVPVAVDGDNPEEVVIDWDAAPLLALARHRQPGVPHLGLFGVRVHPRLASGLELPPGHGVLVLEVTSGGPSQQAGLRRGDVLLAAGDVALREGESLASIVSNRIPGQDLPLEYLRAGVMYTATATLG